MHRKLLKGLLIISSLLVNTSAIGIDGKLDFGTSHSSSASFRSQNGDHKNSLSPVTYAKTIKTVGTNDDFDNIGVVCISGGCNTTKATNISGDTIQADVLVHIHTKVDLNRNATPAVEDTPDVPIVIGYGGSKLDATIDEEDSRSLNQQSLFIPDLDPPSQTPSYKPVYPSNGISFNDPSVNIYYNPSISSSLTPTVSSRVDSISSLPPTVSSRVDSISTFDNFNPSAKVDGFYITKTDPKVNIKVETLPPLAVTTERDKAFIDTKYKANTIEIKIPYFEPSYHNHYYGENPPPQLAWYPKRPNSFNPVEFKTMKTTWTPSAWNRKLAPHRHSTSAGGGELQCTCKEGQKTSGVRWYPSASRGASLNDPGSQINDKLAPLN